MSEENKHILSDKILKEPTEIEMGILESYCICGYKTSKYIPKLDLAEKDNFKESKDFPIAWVIIIIVSSILLFISAAAVVTVIIMKKLKLKKQSHT